MNTDRFMSSLILICIIYTYVDQKFHSIFQYYMFTSKLRGVRATPLPPTRHSLCGRAGRGRGRAASVGAGPWRRAGVSERYAYGVATWPTSAGPPPPAPYAHVIYCHPFLFSVLSLFRHDLWRTATYLYRTASICSEHYLLSTLLSFSIERFFIVSFIK